MRKIIRRIFRSFSYTSVLFIFQACYGMPPDVVVDVHLTGVVKSKSTSQPIKGIKVMSVDTMAYDLTDENGNFDFYTTFRYYEAYYGGYYRENDSISVHFMDIDGTENGSFKDKEIMILPLTYDEKSMEVELEEKESK